jgi:WD40 repeat protein
MIYQNSGDLMEKQQVAVRQTGRCLLGSRYNEYVNFSWLFEYEVDDSRFFVTAGADRTICFWNAETGRLIFKWATSGVVRHLRVLYSLIFKIFSAFFWK